MSRRGTISITEIFKEQQTLHGGSIGFTIDEVSLQHSIRSVTPILWEAIRSAVRFLAVCGDFLKIMFLNAVAAQVA